MLPEFLHLHRFFRRDDLMTDDLWKFSDATPGGLDSMEDTPMVQLGDASTAAPFTTRTPSISSVACPIGVGQMHVIVEHV